MPRQDGSAGRLHAAFLQLLEALCRERPVVVIVEDLHWSDASTRNLLMHTMRAARQIPLLLVGTYRTDELTRRHPLRPFLAEVARLRSTDVVELDRLDAAACRPSSSPRPSAAGPRRRWWRRCTSGAAGTRSSSKR